MGSRARRHLGGTEKEVVAGMEAFDISDRTWRFGAALYRAYINKGFTQYTLSEVISREVGYRVGQPRVSNLVHGKVSSIEVGLLEALERVLEVRLPEIDTRDFKPARTHGGNPGKGRKHGAHTVLAPGKNRGRPAAGLDHIEEPTQSSVRLVDNEPTPANEATQMEEYLFSYALELEEEVRRLKGLLRQVAYLAGGDK